MKQQNAKWIGAGIAVAVLAVIALVVAIVVLPNRDNNTVAEPTPTATAEPTPEADTATETAEQQVEIDAVNFSRNDPDDPMAIGDIDAPILMIEWADLRCHYCGVFANETLPGLISEYVDAGLLRIEWHSAVVLGDTSADAAVAVRAAGQQGLFWEYLETLYATEPTGQTVWDTAALVALAEQVPGMDVARFTADLADPTLIAAAEAEAAQSLAWGVTGTPVFVVGDQLLTGAEPLDTFTQAIESQLP